MTLFGVSRESNGQWHQNPAFARSGGTDETKWRPEFGPRALSLDTFGLQLLSWVWERIFIVRRSYQRVAAAAEIRGYVKVFEGMFLIATETL